MHQLTWEWP